MKSQSLKYKNTVNSVEKLSTTYVQPKKVVEHFITGMRQLIMELYTKYLKRLSYSVRLLHFLSKNNSSCPPAHRSLLILRCFANVIIIIIIIIIIIFIPSIGVPEGVQKNYE